MQTREKPAPCTLPARAWLRPLRGVAAECGNIFEESEQPASLSNSARGPYLHPGPATLLRSQLPPLRSEHIACLILLSADENRWPLNLDDREVQPSSNCLTTSLWVPIRRAQVESAGVTVFARTPWSWLAPSIWGGVGRPRCGQSN